MTTGVAIRHTVTVTLSAEEVARALRAHLVRLLDDALLPPPADLDGLAPDWDEAGGGCVFAFEPAPAPLALPAPAPVAVDAAPATGGGMAEPARVPVPRDRAWSEAEEDTLRRLWPVASRQELLAALPGRSWKAITVRGWGHLTLGARPSDGGAHYAGWPEAEIALLREFYPTASIKALLEILPGRNWTAIKNKAHRLGLQRVSTAVTPEGSGAAPDLDTPSTPPEAGVDDTLTRGEPPAAPVEAPPAPAAVPADPPSSDRPGRWTTEEDAALRRLYPRAQQGELQAACPTRSWKSIEQRAWRLGIRRVAQAEAHAEPAPAPKPAAVFAAPERQPAERLRLWSEEEDANLRRYWPKATRGLLKVVLSRRGFVAMAERARQLGIERLVDDTADISAALTVAPRRPDEAAPRVDVTAVLAGDPAPDRSALRDMPPPAPAEDLQAEADERAGRALAAEILRQTGIE